MRIVSGIQPSGLLHVGNYLGAIKQWIDLQNEHECLFPIVDLHAITEPYEPKDLQQRIHDVALDYIALGLDPKKCLLFVQSHVPEHVELMWLLSTTTPIGDLERMTQYKDKAKQFASHGINAGLFVYPILMAADILLYKAEGVPVGEDQTQHLELTRTIAQKFNKRFGEIFPEPKTILPKTGAKVLSLKDPTKKMSKSHGEDSFIALADPPDVIRKKIKRAVTDSGKDVVFDPKKRPAISNLLTIFSLFSGRSLKDSEHFYKEKGYETLKNDLGGILVKSLSLFQQKRAALARKPEYIPMILEAGASRARQLAQTTIAEVHSKMGIR